MLALATYVKIANTQVGIEPNEKKIRTIGLHMEIVHRDLFRQVSAVFTSGGRCSKRAVVFEVGTTFQNLSGLVLGAGKQWSQDMDE